jgi:glycerol transport system substrate-binding protein
VSETITTHEYESKTLAKAFTEITGIKVKHDLIQEGDVVEKLQTQMQSGKNVYDGWINDSDLIGTHFRYGQTVILSDYMTGEGKDVTNPQLDVNDFIGKSFTTGPDGKIGWVQQVGFAPDQVTADDTQFYGVGAFLLAGSQVRELHRVK